MQTTLENDAHLLLAAVRRVRAASGSHREEPELAHAARFRSFLEAVLDSAETGTRRPLEKHLERTIPALARRGLTAAQLRLEVDEAEHVLAELSAPEGAPARLQRALSMLRLAERMLVAGVQNRRRESRHDDELRLATVLDALPEAIVLADAEGRVQLANARARAMYALLDPAGRPLDEILAGKSLLARLADPDAYLDATRLLLHDNLEPREDLFRDEDENAYVRRSIPVGEGGSSGRVVITTSVSEVRGRSSGLPPVADPPLPAIEPSPSLPRLRLVVG
jgi:PAS domain-containing protein